MNKREALSKTLVLDYTVKLADINRVSRMVEDAVSVKIDPSSEFVTQQDANIGPVDAQTEGDVVTLRNIKKFILIRSWGPFNVKLDSLVVIPCSGVFAVTGSFNQIEISADDRLRISYVYS